MIFCSLFSSHLIFFLPISLLIPILTRLVGTVLAPYSPPAFAQSPWPPQVLSFLYSLHWKCSLASYSMWTWELQASNRKRRCWGYMKPLCGSTPQHHVTRSDMSRELEIWNLCEDLLNFEGRHQILKNLKHHEGEKNACRLDFASDFQPVICVHNPSLINWYLCPHLPLSSSTLPVIISGRFHLTVRLTPQTQNWTPENHSPSGFFMSIKLLLFLLFRFKISGININTLFPKT